MKLNSIKYYFPAILVASILFYLSSLPGSSVPSLGLKFEDLFMHCIAYSALGFTLGIALIHEGIEATWTRIGWAILIGTLYGVSDEFHQSFVPGRESTIPDIVADAVGSCLGLFVYLKRSNWFRRLAKSSEA